MRAVAKNRNVSRVSQVLPELFPLPNAALPTTPALSSRGASKKLGARHVVCSCASRHLAPRSHASTLVSVGSSVGVRRLYSCHCGSLPNLASVTS